MKSQSREARLNNESSKSQFCGMKGRKSHFLYIISVVSMDEKAKMIGKNGCFGEVKRLRRGAQKSKFLRKDSKYLIIR